MNIVGYYQFDKEEFSIAMVLKEFWEEHGFMSDSGEEEEFVPDRFFELSSSTYEHTYSSTHEAKDVLNAAGWVEKNMFDL